MTALASMIAELPPVIRYSRNNIIVHSLWTGNFDLNECLRYYNKEIDFMIKNGLFIKVLNEHFNIRVITLLADTVGRPKISNSTQFNGAFGCLHCLHPNGKVKVCDCIDLKCSCRKPCLYLYNNIIQERTNIMYNEDAKEADYTKKESEE